MTQNEMPKIKTTFGMSNKLYDVLKFCALIGMPAVATLYFTLGNLWGWEAVEQVIGTIVALQVFLGAILGISTSSHKKALQNLPDSKLILDDEDGVAYAEFNFHPSDLNPGDDVNLKVVKAPQGKHSL